MVEESEELVQRAMERLRAITTRDRDVLLFVEYRETKEKCTMILAAVEQMIGEFVDEAIIGRGDASHFLEQVTFLFSTVSFLLRILFVSISTDVSITSLHRLVDTPRIQSVPTLSILHLST